jgi:DNA-binding GntR family transcriptional regulator
MPAAKATPDTTTCSYQRRSLAETAYQTLYGKIISLAYPPGQPLEEAALVEELGIGRTPVREALQRLAADLLVESQPGKGFVVRPITLQNTKAAFAALRILELGVAELAVRQENRLLLEAMRDANNQVADAVGEMDIYRLVEANSAFHDAFARCSDNIYLVQSLQKVRCETNRLAYLSFGNEIDPERNLQEHYASVIDQHNGVIEALHDRDADRLKALIVDHIGIFKRRIIHYLAEF